MRLIFTATGWDDYLHWHTADRAVLKRVNRLIEDALREPFDGLGHPEQLKHGQVPGSWSRRITEEHRLVYVVNDDDLVIYQARYHYRK